MICFDVYLSLLESQNWSSIPKSTGHLYQSQPPEGHRISFLPINNHFLTGYKLQRGTSGFIITISQGEEVPFTSHFDLRVNTAGECDNFDHEVGTNSEIHSGHDMGMLFFCIKDKLLTVNSECQTPWCRMDLQF